LVQRAQAHPVGSKGRSDGGATATGAAGCSVVNSLAFACNRLATGLATAGLLNSTRAARARGQEKRVSLAKVMVFLPVFAFTF
jgi:hypothetical protein